MSLSNKKVASKHLVLAEGFIKTTNIGETASEYEIRNAFSRSYYALFHASCGYLWAQDLPDAPVIWKRHGSLHAEMGRRMGKSIRLFLKNCYDLRCKSDYDQEWSLPPVYLCLERLKHARGQFYFVTLTAKNLISQAASRRIR